MFTYSFFYINMVGKGKEYFAKVAHATRKGKTIAGTLVLPLKWARHQEEVIVLPPPPLITALVAPSGPSSSQLEIAVRGTPPPSPSCSVPLTYEAVGTGAPGLRVSNI